MRVNISDLAAGAIFAAFGLYFAITAYTALSIGTAFMMGPGYFPLIIGVGLIVFGLVIGARAFGRTFEPFTWPPLTSVLMVAATPIVFGLTVRGLGFGPATALAAFVASMASREASWKFRLLLTLGLTIFCLTIFRFALNLPLPIIGHWLS